MYEGRFNRFAKITFFDHPTPLSPTITLCHVCSRDPSCVTPRSAQHPPRPTPPLPNKKKEILGFKKDRSTSKEISNINSNI